MERVTYPPASLASARPSNPYLPHSSASHNGESQRELELKELQESIPDILQLDGTGTLWQLPVELPPIGGSSEWTIVHLQMTVPADYPMVAPALKVVEHETMPPHFWVDDKTGVMALGVLECWDNAASRDPLRDIVLQAYTALSSKRYSPGPRAGTRGRPFANLRSHLQAKDNAELLKLLTDDAAFAAQVQELLGDTAEAKQVEAKRKQLARRAANNLALVNEYQGITQQIRITSQAEMPEAAKRYEDMVSRQTQVSSAVDLPVMLRVLKERRAEAEEQAEQRDAELQSMGADAAEHHVSATVSGLLEARRRFHSLDAKIKSAEATFW